MLPTARSSSQRRRDNCLTSMASQLDVQTSGLTVRASRPLRLNHHPVDIERTASPVPRPCISPTYEHRQLIVLHFGLTKDGVNKKAIGYAKASLILACDFYLPGRSERRITWGACGHLFDYLHFRDGSGYEVVVLWNAVSKTRINRRLSILVPRAHVNV